MKKLLPIIFFALALNVNSQSTLCEKNSIMYSSCYELNENGTFEYEYDHCTGTVYGKGSYKETKSSITFTFDSIVPQEIKALTIENDNYGIVVISMFDIVHGGMMEFSEINYKQNRYLTDEFGAARIPYSGGPIVLYQYYKADSIIINPDKDNWNVYEIFWHSNGDTFVNSGTKIVMKKKGSKYELKEEALGYDMEKNVYYPKMRTTYYVKGKK